MMMVVVVGFNIYCTWLRQLYKYQVELLKYMYIRDSNLPEIGRFNDQNSKRSVVTHLKKLSQNYPSTYSRTEVSVLDG